MHNSLCDSQFYPLIHTKWMSYGEKLEYRAKHGVPVTIDKWIADGKMNTEAPTSNPHKRDPLASHTYVPSQDNVECILNIAREESESEVSIFYSTGRKSITLPGSFQSPKILTFTLRLRVPQTTGYLLSYWHSPTVIIDQFTEGSLSKHSPDWLEFVKTELKFWQSRILMLEMMLYFVQTIPHNSKISRKVASWCNAMSVSRII